MSADTQQDRRAAMRARIAAKVAKGPPPPPTHVQTARRFAANHAPTDEQYARHLAWADRTDRA